MRHEIIKPRSIVSGVIWSALDSAVGQALTLAIYMIMARLLSPQILGIVATGALALEFCRAVLIESIAIAVQARPDPKDEDYTASFWLIAGLSLFAALALFASSGAIERFSGLSDLAIVLKGFCIVVAVQGLSRTHEAWLTRNQLFRSLAIRSLSSISIGGAVGIALAIQGYGVVALVGQLVSTSLISLVSLWILTPWRPRLRVSRQAVIDLLSYARYVALTGITNFANANSDLIFVTWYTGAAGAGFYSLAKRLVNAVSTVIGNALNRVFFSTIAGLQHDREASRSTLVDFVKYTSLLTAPLFAGIAALAPDLIVGFFGSKWGEAAPLLAIMSITGFLTTIGLYNHSVILAFGKPHWQTWLTLIYAVSNIAIFIVAAPFGLIAIAVGYVVRALLLYPLSAGASMRILALGIRPYAAALMPALAGSAVMACAVVAASVTMPATSPWLRLAALVLLGSSVYLAVVMAVARPAVVRIWQEVLGRVRRSSKT
ncbi:MULTISPECIES: lipopolysaccharide biosynthesis protein [Bradyrhizobium]|uniref:Membrane protein involved in the export of O-antigen and teichoic acid n=1 Tax=Bradyrhizobium yuanmingense TaxID=108015 RepID=A0A1C3WTJ3_9BRAD|nr:MULTISPECIES: lipopolysaccharide biosynthesis protein [Bradyrhizobium]MCA1495169.1 lipopolysaccharide biosynthesis protein [Bradyrhizobium sp. NBAIM14]MCA1530977.1 lipopolysaccharide biosynthesis protein [Bradyrhizobium sp. NBAIM03]TWI23440.1 O-antigen/teichoic acid export membrane protein [Bradyrhizobium yuanmingense]SCB43383.1 Membrane protein involved in the export of O-antigen and teichoic acid [Bradyrhizobium yuanmingense]